MFKGHAASKVSNRLARQWPSGLRCSWKSDPVRGAEGHWVNNSRASFPESQNFRREAAHEDKTDHSEPTGNGAQMQLGQMYRSLVR